jgi:type IV secretion system protein VirB4
MNRGAAVRRELPGSRHIPYTAHVAPEVVVTSSGDYVQTFRMSGASFESADDETLNNWHERLNVTWRNIASPNVALWTHLVRRRDTPHVVPPKGTSFADRLAARYQARLATETLMVNEIYLTVLFRPITGAAPTLVSRVLSRRSAPSARNERAASLEVCAKLRQTIAASLMRYEPELLGVYAEKDGSALHCPARRSRRCSRRAACSSAARRWSTARRR